MVQLPQMPPRIAALPRDKRGYPIPYFVPRDSAGEPMFQLGDEEKLVRCMNRRRCWICGEPLGRFMAFVLGPTSTMTRVTSEPPSHTACACFAVQACPFLIRPEMRRMPPVEGSVAPVDGHREENPGLTAVWVCESYGTVPRGDRTLFRPGAPSDVLWWARGKQAGAEEIAGPFTRAARALIEAASEQSGQEGGFRAIDSIRLAMSLTPPGTTELVRTELAKDGS